uniref:Uncharacterized protein n=1 Tax=Strongyloides stercoralis TaxID=6248 RepID=A0A0K0E3E3_STRER
MTSNEESIQNLKLKYIDSSLKLSIRRNERIEAYNKLLEEENYLYKELPGELADALIENIEKEHVYKMSVRANKKLLEEQDRLSKEIEALEKEKKTLENGLNDTFKRTNELENTIQKINEEIRQLDEHNTLIEEKLKSEIYRARSILHPKTNF